MTDYYTGAPVQTGPPQQQPLKQPANAKSPKKEGWRNVASTISILLIAPLVALFLTAFVFQSYQVDGPSMETTLYNSDRLLVWKVPRTWARITGHNYIPKRGDVIIFTERDLSEFGSDGGKQLIKRVIGLPGEHVVVSNNSVKVYNKQNPGGFEPDTTLHYGTVIKNTNGDVDLVVPDQHVFVMGDNRTNSLDSRAFGPVATQDIVGKLVLRVWPLANAEKF
jgi:signal peptidase I